jgi:hypothetical protein
MRSVARDPGPAPSLGLATIAVALSLNACHDVARTVDPQAPQVNATVVGSPITIDSTFNFFAVDVTMRVTGAPTSSQPDLPRTIAYHLERTLGGNGVWTTTLTLTDAQPFGRPVSGGISTVDVAKIVTTSDGTVGQVYDRQGHLLTPPPPVSLEALLQGPSRLPSPSRDTLPLWPNHFDGSAARSPVARIGAAAANVDPRAWIRRFIVTAAERQAMRTAVGQQFGSPVGTVGGLERYTKMVDPLLYEVLVDPGSGIIMEENLAEHGRLRVHTVHRFALLPNGTFVRTGERSEMAGAQGSVPRAIIETTFSNLRVETRGGAQ